MHKRGKARRGFPVTNRRHELVDRHSP
jgi:hypothetical protein